LDGLEEICRSGAENVELAEVLGRKAELELDSVRRREILAELARLREVKLEDLDGAIAAWRTIVEQDPSDGDALAALTSLYERREEWEELLAVLDSQAQNVDDAADQVALKHRQGEVLVLLIKDTRRAIDVYRDILDMDPDDRRALAALEEIHTMREDWSSLQEILLWRLDRLEETARVPVFLRLGELCLERLDAMDEAVGYYHQVLAIDPSNFEALDLLKTTLRQAERWYDLVEALRKHAEILSSQGDTAGEVEMLAQVARVWNERLDNPDAAGEVLEEILERDPTNVVALAGLARIYEKTEQWDKCRDVLERAAAQGPEPKEAAELEFRMGRVEVNQSGDPEAAVVHYREALALDPTHQEAMDTLEELARKKKDWGTVADVLELKVQLPELAGAELVGVMQELGLLYVEKTQQADRGVELLEKAREMHPDNLEVTTALADAYYAADQLSRAEPLLQRLIELSGSRRRKEAAKYVHRLGAIAEKRGEIEAAREHYDKAYRMDSTNIPTLVALGQIYFQQQDWDSARRIYRSMLLQNLDESAGITKADVFFHLGQVHAALGEGAKAKSMFERGLEVDPAHAALTEALEALRG
jgi:tetratricopeptide (TPR) repeat protein